MGQLVDGNWQVENLAPKTRDGSFKRQVQHYMDCITADGDPGYPGSTGYQAAADRYHLYVSYACPWAHRALIMRALKGLESLLPVSVVHWLMGDKGWSFAAGEGTNGDPLYGAEHLYQLYQKSDPAFTGRVTVPILWDKQSEKIVNNESAEVIRILNRAFDDLGAAAGDYYPEHLREEIDAVNERVYTAVNNGVYKCGFATTQQAYDDNIGVLFETLDWLESRLAESRYLVGDEMTEADIRLFTTLIRFDIVYVGHFKCNVRRITDYPNLWGFTRDMYQQPKIRPTVNFEHIKKHYYQSHLHINPTGIVPAGPEIDFDEPHGRG